MGVGGKLHVPTTLPPGKRSGNSVYSDINILLIIWPYTNVLVIYLMAHSPTSGKVNNAWISTFHMPAWHSRTF